MAEPPPPSSAAADRAARRHLAALLAGIAAITLGLALFAWRLGPPDGDLARISGASERAFGWRGEATGFAENAYDRVPLRALLAGAPPGDILVFGDSFSIMHRGGISWINALQARTGRRIRFVRIEDFGPPMRYFASRAYAQDPPAAVIVQSVERGVAIRAAALARDCPAPDASAAPLAVLTPGPGAPLDPPRRSFRRPERFEGMEDLLSWGALAARLRLTGGSEPVLEVGLTRGDLFSHAASDRLLLLGADVDEHDAAAIAALGGPERAEARILCGLRRLAEAAGATRSGPAPLRPVPLRPVPFRLVIAPDKRTIYAPWIEDALPDKILDLFALARRALGPRFVDLSAPLGAAAQAGTRDLYWPDDSHWGAVGHRMAGRRAAASLLGEAP